MRSTVNEDTLRRLLEEQKPETLTVEEDMIVKKKLMMKKFGIKRVNKKFLKVYEKLKEHHDKLEKLCNIKIFDEIDVKEMSHEVMKLKEDLLFVNDILKCLGMSLKKDNRYTRKEMEHKIIECYGKSILILILNKM